MQVICLYQAILRGRGYVVLNWSPVTGATGYKVWVFDGYQYRAFDVGNTSTWDSRVWRIWPDMNWLNSQGDNTITTDVFNKVKGGGDLPDTPNLLYKKTYGTSYDSDHKYYFRVSAYNPSWDSFRDLDLYAQVTVALPDRTDTIRPTGSVKINNDAEATKTTNVTLNLSASDLV